MSKDLSLSTSSENKFKYPKFESNILKMRKAIRRNEYLSNPEERSELTSLDGKVLNKQVLDIINIGKQARKTNILNAMNTSDFFAPQTIKKFCVFNEGEDFVEDTDYEIRVLISAIDNANQRNDMYLFYENEKSKSDFSAQEFLDNLLTHKFDVFSLEEII